MNQPGTLHVDVRFQNRPAQPSDRMQNDVQITLIVQDEQSRSPRLHQPLNVLDEVGTDPDCGSRNAALPMLPTIAPIDAPVIVAPSTRPTSKPTAEEPATLAIFGSGCSVERERPVGMPNDDRNV